MAEFKMQIAGHTALVHTLFESTQDYCRAYWSDDPPEFSVTVSREDLAFEQEKLDEEARAEGFRFRKFTDPFLERAAIQRAFAEYLFGSDILLFHGSAVAVDGEGYLFTARSGTGKSTHTRLWREVFGERAVMINDDKPFLILREDAVLVCGAPWSGKHGLDTNIAVPLKGICILERGTENRIRKAAPAEVLETLRAQTYQPLDEALLPHCLALADSLARRAGLWRMECTREHQAARTAFEAMSGHRRYAADA